METIETLVGVLVALPILAAVGITTLAAFALMTVLGLLTEMSFKRLFFVSFAMGLAAPMLAAGALFSAIGDPGFQRDLSEGFDQLVQVPEETGEAVTLGPLIPRIRELRADMEQGELTEEEIERRIEALFEGSDTVVEAAEAQAQQADAAGEEMTVDIDGVQLSRDGDTVRIKID